MSSYEAFRQFDADNPQVYRRLVELAREAMRSGRQRIGMRLLFERVRWDMLMQTDSTDGFKINNNFAPHYARAIIARHQEFDGFFMLRACRGEQMELIGRAA